MSRAGPVTRSRRRKSGKYQWLQWCETSSAPDSDSGRTSAAQHVGGIRRYPRTEISKFQIARCQFAELKIELTFCRYVFDLSSSVMPLPVSCNSLQVLILLWNKCCEVLSLFCNCIHDISLLIVCCSICR